MKVNKFEIDFLVYFVYLDEIVRVVEKRGKDCRLHYWFYPDSFDIWVSNVDAEESEKRDETFTGIWHVAANWILDTAEFNEWMNEEDYEIDEDLVRKEMKVFQINNFICFREENKEGLN